MFALELVEKFPPRRARWTKFARRSCRTGKPTRSRIACGQADNRLIAQVERGTAIDALGLDSLRFADLSRSDPVPDLPRAV